MSWEFIGADWKWRGADKPTSQPPMIDRIEYAQVDSSKSTWRSISKDAMASGGTRYKMPCAIHIKGERVPVNFDDRTMSWARQQGISITFP